MVGAEEHRAESKLYALLTDILGPGHPGLAAFGLRFDTRRKALYLGVDLDPVVPRAIEERIPREVDHVPIRTRRLTLHQEGNEGF